MTDNQIIIEQLFEELVSQDPSLQDQKEDILWLLSRMSDNVPPVSIDPLFQSNLRSRLETHIQYMNDLKARSTKPWFDMNRLSKLIAYGLPTIALGVMIFLALPWSDDPQHATLSTPPTATIEWNNTDINKTSLESTDDTSISVSDSAIISDEPLVAPAIPSRPEPRDMQAEPTEMIQYIDTPTYRDEEQALIEHRETLPSPAMIETTQDIYNPDDMDALIEDTKKNQSYLQIYKTGDLEMSYTFYYKPNYHLMWSLHTCGTSYIISTPISQETTRITTDAYLIDSTTIVPVTLLFKWETIVGVEGITCGKH